VEKIDQRTDIVKDHLTTPTFVSFKYKAGIQQSATQEFMAALMPLHGPTELGTQIV
jgi:hypothetical protein